MNFVTKIRTGFLETDGDASAVDYVEYCDTQRSTGMMHLPPDLMGPEPTFTWAGGEDIP